MLTNPRDALRGQSRSPNIVPFHMLGIFPLKSLRRAVFSIFDFQKCRDLENPRQKSLKVIVSGTIL